VAQTPSSEPLLDSARQYWVVLDGRTGLAKAREGITEAELAGDEFVISREKLILPKKTDVNDLTLTVTNPDGSNSTGNPLNGLTGLPGGDLNSLLKAAQTGAGKAPTTPKNAIPKFPGDPSVKPLQPIPPPGPGEAAPADGTQQGGTMDQLDQKLSDSDLTEQEQERIRQSLKGNKGR
jgi:hypothetical protein